MRNLLFLLVPLTLTGCGDSYEEAHARDEHHSKKARIKSEAKHVGHETEHAFRKVGGHLEKFFRGHDTISD